MRLDKPDPKLFAYKLMVIKNAPFKSKICSYFLLVTKVSNNQLQNPIEAKFYKTPNI